MLTALASAAAVTGVLLASAAATPGVPLPPCQWEDGPGPCYWDASASGNGDGRSLFVIGDDHFLYLSDVRHR